MRKVQLYDETAPAYHRRYRQIQRTKYQAVTPLLNAGLIIDVGIGTGIGLSSLAGFSPIVGVDGAIEMLRVARKQIGNLGKDVSSISLVCAFVEALPFRNCSFPTAISITMIQNLADIRRGLNELIRIIEKKGMLAITSLSRILSLQDLEAHIEIDYNVIAYFENLAEEDDGVIIQLR